jgi:hypothetical protein
VTISPTAALFPGWRGHQPYGGALAAARALIRPAPTGWCETFEAIQAAQPPYAGYTHVSEGLAAHAAKAPMEHLAALLLWHIDRFEAVFRTSRLDPEFELQIVDSLHRILSRLIQGIDWLRLGRDDFMKELGIVRLSVLPAVAQLIYPWSGLSRSVVLRAGPRVWGYVMGSCGGLKPFLEIHTHDQMAGAYFNGNGWDETYRLVRKLYATFPDHRGMAGLSWFYDPALSVLSPRLDYLRSVPVAGGARLIRVGTSDADHALATHSSATRREAAAQGRYLPTKYALVWSRHAMTAST